MKVEDIPRLFTPETFCKLVIARAARSQGRGLSASSAPPSRQCPPTSRMADPITSPRSRSSTGSPSSSRAARARASTRCRRDIAAFPACLVAEAVGPARGVGRDGAHRLSRPAGRGARQRDALPARRSRPGSTLDLAVEIENCDDEAVAYAGWASVDGDARDRARRLPRPDAAGRRVRRARRRSPRASRCCAAPARAPGRFRGVAAAARRHARRARRAANPRPRRCAVPATAPFFADHFPRRPVFPATLLLDAQIGLALRARRATPPTGLPARRRAPSRMTHVKVRSFIAARRQRSSSARELQRPRRRTRDGSRSRAQSRRQDGRHRAGRNRRRETARMNATPASAASRSPASAWSRRSATTSPRPGTRCSPAGAAARRSRMFDASGFPVRIAAEVKGFDDDAARRPQAAEAHQPLAPLRARGRRAGAARRRHPPDRRRRATRWGCAVGAGMMTSEFADLAATHAHCAAPTASSHADLLLTDPAANDPMVFCRSQATAGHCAAHAPLRHPRLRDLGAHRLRVGRPGARHGAEADPPRRRRLRAGRRLRLDDQPGRPRRLLPAVGACRPTTTRRSARAARSTRRATASCWAKARASWCSRSGKRRAARGARIYAELAGDGNSLSSLPDHRFAARRRRADPGDARGARRRRRDARRRRLPQRARHVDADERPQRERRDARGVRRRRRRASA